MIVSYRRIAKGELNARDKRNGSVRFAIRDFVMLFEFDPVPIFIGRFFNMREGEMMKLRASIRIKQQNLLKLIKKVLAEHVFGSEWPSQASLKLAAEGEKLPAGALKKAIKEWATKQAGKYAVRVCRT